MASLDHEMHIRLDVAPTPAMREFVRTIVRETLEQARDQALIDDALLDEELAEDLKGRLIRIEAPNLSQHHSRVVFVDTEEDVPGVRRVELVLDVQTDTASVKLYRWKQKTCQGATLEYAMTDLVEGIMALARIDEVVEE